MADLGEDVKEAIGGRYRKAYETARKYLGEPGQPSGPAKKVDTSYHDEMLKKANESFAKPAPLVDKTIGTKKRATKGKASQKSTKRY